MVTTPIWINSTNSPSKVPLFWVSDHHSSEVAAVPPMGFPGNDPAMIPLHQVAV